MASGWTQTFVAGRTMKSANAPSRLTPMPMVLMHTWRRPARQLRQWPQTMCPSPDTRAPTATAVPAGTSSPTSTISP